ncbi:MAG TPA: GTP-binding protein, partial [Bacteroidetes bacterium]|nr:GTP-binding protein [Bacteroidota bacterium]
MTSKKVILAGSFGVGKTSLFSRFLYNTFSEKYMTTIGVKVDKKVMDINGRKLTMIIWDIAGEVSQTKVPTNYLLGASGIIYVFDLSRPSTFTNMEEDIQYLNKMLEGALIKIVGNKKDLLSEEELAAIP